MKVGIIGAGNIGAALARIFAGAGHHVVISGSRDAEKLRVAAEKAGPNARSGTPAEAAAFGDVVTLAVNWPSVPEVLAQVGSLDGKVLLDVTNPLLPDMSAMEIGITDSGGEQIARLAPGAKVVKAYCHVYAQILAADDRDFGPVRPAGFYCGDDPDAKAKVAELISDSGFEPIDAGPLERARDLEAATMFIIRLGYGQGLGPNIAWAVLRR